MDEFAALTERNRQLSKAMMQSVFELACDLSGLGPFPEQAVRARGAHQRAPDADPAAD
jgi:hypothetical protein